jgi:hypothetical protein
MMLRMHAREFQQEILRQLTPRQIRSMVQLPITEPSGSEPGELQCNSDENVCLLPLVLISYVLDHLLKVETVVKENLLFAACLEQMWASSSPPSHCPVAFDVPNCFATPRTRIRLDASANVHAGAVSLCFSNPEDCMHTGSVLVLI